MKLPLIEALDLRPVRIYDRLADGDWAPVGEWACVWDWPPVPAVAVVLIDEDGVEWHPA